MTQVRKSFVLTLGIAMLVAGVMAGHPVLAGGKNVVRGEIVSFDADSNKLVVMSEGGALKVTFSTSARTGVVGLSAGPGQDDVSVLVGMQGAHVMVKFKNGDKGKEATLIRIKPVRG